MAMTPIDIETRDLMRIAGIITIGTCWLSGIGDYIFLSSHKYAGLTYLKRLPQIVCSGGGRPHWATCLAQTTGWFYPLWCFGAWQIYMGLRPAGEVYALPYLVFWSYAMVLVGGARPSAWAFLSVAQQAKASAGCMDNHYFTTVQCYCREHVVFADLPAPTLMLMASIWQVFAVMTGKTLYPMWFVAVLPLPVLCYSLILTLIIPLPSASCFAALSGTSMILIPQIFSTILLWDLPVVDRVDSPMGMSAVEVADEVAWCITGFLVVNVFASGAWLMAHKEDDAGLSNGHHFADLEEGHLEKKAKTDAVAAANQRMESRLSRTESSKSRPTSTRLPRASSLPPELHSASSTTFDMLRSGLRRGPSPVPPPLRGHSRSTVDSRRVPGK